MRRGKKATSNGENASENPFKPSADDQIIAGKPKTSKLTEDYDISRTPKMQTDTQKQQLVEACTVALPQ